MDAENAAIFYPIIFLLSFSLVCFYDIPLHSYIAISTVHRGRVHITAEVLLLISQENHIIDLLVDVIALGSY